MSQVTVIKSNRKTISIQVDLEKNIIVRGPNQMTKTQIDKHLEKHRDWIIKKQIEIEKHTSKAHEYKEGEMFYLLGEERRLTFVKDLKYALVNKDGFFKVDYDSKEHTRNIIITFYKNYAKHALIKRAWEVAEKVNLKPEKFKISSAEKRWGSCSGRGNINLSFHLMPFPFRIIDYVIIHELAHLIYLDHSKEFWDIVHKIMPDYKSRVDWMHEHAATYKI